MPSLRADRGAPANVAYEHYDAARHGTDALAIGGRGGADRCSRPTAEATPGQMGQATSTAPASRRDVRLAFLSSVGDNSRLGGEGDRRFGNFTVNIRVSDQFHCGIVRNLRGSQKSSPPIQTYSMAVSAGDDVEEKLWWGEAERRIAAVD